uniref:Fibrinogen C-terminal domain-containing protein n=1 Tax=Amphimedon queenslandica TaxID=400682 RepID=A0A1X7U3Q7_AMPQE
MHSMEGDNRQTYQGLKQYSLNENNVYELCQTSRNGERRAEVPKDIKESSNKEISKPVVILIIVLLSLIVILLVGIFCLMLSQVIRKDTTSTTVPATGATTGASTSGNGSPPGAVDDILLIAQKLYNDSTALPTSCEQLKMRHQNLNSGYYILASANGSTTHTYCNMGLICGSTGWRRIAYFNSYAEACPSGFRLYQSRFNGACGRPVTNSSSCASVQFPSNGISYSQICGRVTGYQYGSTDAVNNLSSSYRNDLNSYYVDGVSITRGSPRQHVWTLMAGESEVTTSSRSCPCNTGSSVSVQSFIGNDYFCESGNTDNSTSSTLYTSDRLWDRNGYYCRSLESPCCNVPGIPWFHRDYGSTTTTDYIELRVCGDEGTDDEDSPVTSYEIYIK